MSKNKLSPFHVATNLRVRQSAVVLVARRREWVKNETITEADFPRGKGLRFDSKWEVLLGQNECINWIRSKSVSQLKAMRYPGEWKFPGGNKEAQETLRDCARRELYEEFIKPAGIGFDDFASQLELRYVTCKQTRAVRGVSNMMHVYVALESENEIVRTFLADTTRANAALEARRATFQGLLREGERFWSMSRAEKEELSPEVRSLRWFPLAEAVRHCLASLQQPPNVKYNSEFQREGLARLGIKTRDPMFISGVSAVQRYYSICLVSSFPFDNIREDEISTIEKAHNAPPCDNPETHQIYDHCALKACLVELECFPSEASVASKASRALRLAGSKQDADAEATLKAAGESARWTPQRQEFAASEHEECRGAKDAQWLFEGMDNEAVMDAFRAHTTRYSGRDPSFKTGPEVEMLKQRRREMESGESRL